MELSRTEAEKIGKDAGAHVADCIHQASKQLSRLRLLEEVRIREILQGLTDCACKKEANPDTKKKPTRYDVEIHTWFERDRQHIEIRDKKTDKTLAEWWDDAVTEMFEDGFFKPGTIRHEGMSGREFENSILEYAEDMGILAKE